MFDKISLLLLLSSHVFGQVDFGSDDAGAASKSSEFSEGDVDSRFFNINFDGGQILGTAAGTLLGNVGSDIIKDCFGIGKRSIIMDRIYNKRSAQEVDSKSAPTSEDVDSRLFCLGNNNNNHYNSRPNCNFCNCYNDNQCYNQCQKCYNNNNYGGNNYGSNSGVNCNTCYCSSNSCFNTCRKCVSSGSYSSGSSSNSNYGTSSLNCNTCSCTYSSSCRSQCYKCSNSYNNNGWRNTGTSARDGTTSSDSSNEGAISFSDA